MADQDNSKKSGQTTPAPEELQLKADENKPAETLADKSAPAAKQKIPLRKRGTFRPSHKATFIGLVAVVIILAINAGIITFVLKHQSSSKNNLASGQVTISSSALDKLGVNRTAVGDAGIELTVGPNARFAGNVQVAGSANIAGQLTLNSTFVASNANLTQLQAGNTTLSQLNVNGNGTMSNLNVRSNLVVGGQTQLQGPVIATNQFNINNNLAVSGNIVVGGTLEVGSFQTSNLTIDGHVIVLGAAPSVSAGSAAGSYGTASISGSDAAGTIVVNAGSGAGSGVAVNVTFRSPYGSIPNVVVSPIGYGLVTYVSRNANGFSIGVSPLTPLAAGTSYAFDYIVEQ